VGRRDTAKDNAHDVAWSALNSVAITPIGEPTME
jgi:hypothetical protein